MIVALTVKSWCLLSNKKKICELYFSLCKMAKWRLPETPKKSPVGSQDAFKKWSECGANTRSVNELKPPVFSQSERKIVALDLPAPASGIHGFFRFKVTSLSTSGKSVFAANIRAHPCLCWTGRSFMICVLTWIYQPSLWF